MAASTSRGRHVGTAGLDQVAVAALEVEEAVRVDRHQVPAAVPAVGGERLGPLPPVVALHEERAPEPQLTHRAGVGRRARLGVDHPSLQARRRATEGAAPVLGLVPLVVGHQAHAAGLGHAQHGVAQLGVGRGHVGRHDRPQVAPPDGAEGRGGRSRDRRAGGRRWPRSRWSWWAGLVRAGRARRRPSARWSTPVGLRPPACPAARRRTPRSRRTASWRTAPRRVCSVGAG